MKNLFVMVALALAGCATAYQPIGTDVTGGYETRRVAEGVFVVSFYGNGFTAPKRAVDFAMLRAAETTLEYNFRYFIIWGTEDASSSSTIHLGSNSYTTGTVNSFGGYTANTQTYDNTVTAFKPGNVMTIMCFDSLPKGRHVGQVYDARQVKAELRAKYHLK